MENNQTKVLTITGLFNQLFAVAKRALYLTDAISKEKPQTKIEEKFAALNKALADLNNIADGEAKDILMAAIDDRSMPVPGGKFDVNGEPHMLDSQKRLCPISMVREIDQVRDSFVRELIGGALFLNAAIRRFKERSFEDIVAFMEMSAEQHGVTWGGEGGNVTLRSHCGRYMMKLAVSEKIAFDEGFQVAKKLVEECIDEWSSESRPEIKMLVQQAFAPNSEGKLSLGKILALRRIQITHEKWQRAMKLIGESVIEEGSKRYVRFYIREDVKNEFAAISLDVASV